MPLTGARRAVMFMLEVVRGVQEAGSGLDAGNSRRQLHAALATGAGYYSAVGTSASRGDNNTRDCRYPGCRERAVAVVAAVDIAVASKRLPCIVV